MKQPALLAQLLHNKTFVQKDLTVLPEHTDQSHAQLALILIGYKLRRKLTVFLVIKPLQPEIQVKLTPTTSLMTGQIGMQMVMGKETRNIALIEDKLSL